MKRAFKRGQKVVKGMPSAVLLAIGIHVGLFFLAGALVIFKVLAPKEVVFEAPQAVERPKMKLKKPKPRIKKSSKPKTERISAKGKQAAIPIEVPDIGGMELGGFEGGFELDISPGDFFEVTEFGSEQSVGNDLVGTFYDFTRRENGRQSSVGIDSFLGELVEFVESGWKSSRLAKYYQAEKKLYATCVMVPPVRSTAAPAAFGHPELAGYLWAVHYEGLLVHPEGITFRFWGQGDDILLVRVGEEIVLIGNWNGSWNQYSHERFMHLWSSDAAETRQFYMGNALSYVGDWITLEPGVPVDIDILIGEAAGGSYCSVLAVEVKGEEYEKGPQGNPILPMFKTASPSRGLIDAIYKNLVPGEVCVTNGPVFCDYDTSGDMVAEEPVDAEPPNVPGEEKLRTWTMVDGKTVEAKFLVIMGKNAVLNNPQGQQVKIPLEQFSDEDRRYMELAQSPRLSLELARKSKNIIGGQSPFNAQLPPKVQELVFTAKIKQKSPGTYNHELDVEFFAIGKESGGERYVLLDRQESRFTPTKENKKYHEFSGRTVRLTTYLMAKDFKGDNYESYLVVVTDERGKIIAHRTSKEWLFENLEKLRNLPLGSYMDKTCTRRFPTRPRAPYY